MALTKVTGQVIKNTTDVTVGVLTVTNTLAVGGTVSIGGTLTYEDVTNVDAVGLITARNGIVVGSGITLSKDGDIFATGVTTTGSLVSSGAISGTTGTFSGAISGTTGTFSGAVSGTTGTFTGNVAVSGANITLQDSGGASDDRLVIGAGSDLSIYHDASDSYLQNATGDLYIQTTGSADDIFISAVDDVQVNTASKTSIKAIGDGAVELYHNNSKKFETASYGVSTDDLLNFNGTGDKILIADNGKISFGGGGDLDIYHDGTNNILECTTTGELRFMYDTQYMLRCIPQAAVRIYYANSTKAQTTNTGFMVNGNLELVDNDKLYLGASGDFQMYHDGTDNIFQSSGLKNFIFKPKDTDVGLKIIGDGGVELYHDNGKKAETNADGFRVSGALQSSSGNGNYYLRTQHTTIQEGGNSVTITLSGLTFSWGVFRIGGYASAGQASVSLHIIFGGYMTHTNNYNATVLANHAQGCSISQTKNNSNYVITITNNANNYDLFCNMMIESANSAFAIALS